MLGAPHPKGNLSDDGPRCRRKSDEKWGWRLAHSDESGWLLPSGVIKQGWKILHSLIFPAINFHWEGVSNGRSFLDQAWQIYVSQGIRVDVTGKLVTCWCDVTFDHIRSVLRCCQTHRSVWLRDRGHHKPFDNRIQHSALVTLHPGLWHSLKYYFIDTPSQASQCS